MSSKQGTDFLPALRFRALTRFYDPLIRATTREATFRRRLLERARLRPGQTVLDLGCGTGTLLIAAAGAEPDARLHGIDPDPAVLERAQRKAQAQGARIDLRQGLAGELPYEDGSFDRVLSSLVFHHLGPDGVRAAASEVARVLRPGGEIHLADWGKPAGPLMTALSWQVKFFDGAETTRESLAGRVPALLGQAGLPEVGGRERLRTAFGTLELAGFRASGTGT